MLRMETQNAFIGTVTQPNSEEIKAALGPSGAAWKQLLKWLAAQGITEQEWKSVSPKYGWALRLKLKKRTILYLAPCADCFTASFALGDKAVSATRGIGLPEKIIALLDAAPRYAEGTGLRIPVRSKTDLPAIEELTRIKLAH
jgi:hypothetical protein